MFVWCVYALLTVQALHCIYTELQQFSTTKNNIQISVVHSTIMTIIYSLFFVFIKTLRYSQF